jgi:DNA transformation protein and related proteins
MNELKGQRLYVNLGASQVRRRLKGFGHGVRKVQSAGRNQAVIIHTATGQHLRELQSLFADVSPSLTADQLGTPIEEVRNVGAASARWLRQAGIASKAELQRFGAVLAYRRVKQLQPRTSLNLLWALAAGLSDRDWRELTEEEKLQLRQQAED